MNLSRISLASVIIVYFLFQLSCQKEPSVEPDLPTARIAVFMPLTGHLTADWQSGIDWIKDAVNDAGGAAGKQLEIIWYDSQDGDIRETAEKIANDTSIIAAIGPLTSSNAMKAAPYFIRNKKVMITPASSGEITRAFAGKDYIWRLIEPDITQARIQVLIAKSKNVKSIALLASDDEYGITFYNWIGFFAREMNIEVTRIEKFDAGLDDVSMHTENVLNTEPELLICVPSNMEQAESMVKKWKESSSASQLFFSDIVYLHEFTNNLGEDAEGIEGTVMIPHPGSGFEIEYNLKYGKKPMLGIAQMYDALMLISYGLEVSGTNDPESLSNAIKKVVDGRDGNAFWDYHAVAQTLKKLGKGIFPDITGATGSLNYDNEFYLDVISSTYAHWQVNLNDFFSLNFYADDGSGRHSSTSSSWRTYASEIQELNEGAGLDIPEKSGLKVLLIASSKGWTNYRHQSDLLACYQKLKSEGVSDEDIILIMEDDIAFNDRNRTPGIIKNSEEAENLYVDMEIDYFLNEVTPDMIQDILMGTSSPEVPEVLETTRGTNILFYFVGHGAPEGLLIDGREEYTLSPPYFKSMLQKVADEKDFRRMLVLVEACYSGIMGEVTDMSSPILCFTAADKNETSKAINFSNTVNVWLSNNFSFHLFNELEENPDTDLLELYANLNTKVYGSHVRIYNEENFGKLVNLQINEFFKP